MPPLPAGLAEARSGGPDTALAFCIESARRTQQAGTASDPAVRQLFTSALARLIRAASRSGDGDPAFQAQVLRMRNAAVDEHARLSAETYRDRRNVIAATDPVAHPGKLRHMPASALRDQLSLLHEQATAGAWDAVKQTVEQLLHGQLPLDHRHLRSPLQALLGLPSLARLQRGDELASFEEVKHYQALCARHGPSAGSRAAAEKGAVSGRRGAATEAGTLQAFREAAAWLNAGAPATAEKARYRAVGQLLVPKGYPGVAENAKNEWDAALLRRADAGDHEELCLLGEAKASPEAAVPDFPRLVRGLQRLSQAEAGTVYAFASSDGEVRITGASLRRLQPSDRAPAPRVIYGCDAPAETSPHLLSASSRGLLLTERASLAFACRLAEGGVLSEDELQPVWEELLRAPRLQTVLHQYDTACTVREAMLHPEDLLAALGSVGAGSGR